MTTWEPKDIGGGAVHVYVDDAELGKTFTGVLFLKDEDVADLIKRLT